MANDTTLIVNPMARGGWLKKKWPVIEPILQRTLGPLDIVFTRQVGDGRPLAKKALESGAKLVLAMGGDGTFREVGAALLEIPENERPPLGWIVGEAGPVPAMGGERARHQVAGAHQEDEHSRQRPAAQRKAGPGDELGELAGIGGPEDLCCAHRGPSLRSPSRSATGHRARAPGKTPSHSGAGMAWTAGFGLAVSA